MFHCKSEGVSRIFTPAFCLARLPDLLPAIAMYKGAAVSVNSDFNLNQIDNSQIASDNYPQITPFPLVWICFGQVFQHGAVCDPVEKVWQLSFNSTTDPVAKNVSRKMPQCFFLCTSMFRCICLKATVLPTISLLLGFC